MKNKYTLPWIIYLFFLVWAQPATAQDKAAQINALLQQYADDQQFNGSVLVAEKGKVIFKKGYGLANMEWTIPNTPDTKHRLGSVTKQFTAMAIMQMVQKGKLKLDGKITDYLPDYPKVTGDRITIHHLLTHTSGIPSYTGFPRFADTISRNPYATADFVKKFAALPLEFEPGSKFSYNNSGYFLLGAILEKISGKTYAQVLQEYIFTPLQMKNTGYDLHGTILPKRATGYEKSPLGYENAPYLDMSIPYAAGSLYSTVQDLYLWDRALYTDKLLPAAARATLFKPYLKHYAYGWFVAKLPLGQLKDSVGIIEHGGGINGFNTLVSRYPKDQHLIVLLNNTGRADLESIRTNILNILYNQPVKAPKKSVANALRLDLGKLPLEAAVKHFNQLKKDLGYNLSEGEINGLGYGLMSSGKLKEALAVFELNAETFPQSGNVYDSRGEYYLLHGDKNLAIRDYQKSLALDPRNENAAQKLKELGQEVAVAAPVAVDAKILETYLGKYELAPAFVVTVTKDGSHLYAQATGQSRFELFPESETKFYLKEVKAQVMFVKNPSGQIDKLVLYQNGQEVPGKRIN